MLRIFLTILILLQFCIIKSQSLDSDGDGISDENDACPKIAGIADNHCCPGISKEVSEANIKRQDSQLSAYLNTFDFNQLSHLIIKKINDYYFNSENLLSNDIIIVSLKVTSFGNDISGAKPQLPEDDETLRSKLENSLWNKKNFEYFLKKNSGKKILTAHSFGNGNNIRISNIDNDNFPSKQFVRGKAIVPVELLDNEDEKLYYYTNHNKDTEEILLSNDIVHRYAGLTIHIQQLKSRKVKVGYYYNFRTGKFKHFQFIHNKWKEISDVEYDRF